PDARRRRATSVRLEAYAHHFFVVFGLGLHRDLGTVCLEDAPAATAADVALVLAWRHFRVLRAKLAYLRRKFDRRLLALPARIGDADILNSRGRVDWYCGSRGACHGRRRRLGDVAPYHRR